jgi:preprotein translocase subunit SecG
MLETILIVLHVAVCLFLIFVVLLQSGQAADLAGAFGGGGSQTALGMRGAATLLQKLTTASAIIFMLTSLSLGIVGRSESTVIDDTPPVSAPQTPGADGQQDGQAPGQSDGQQ